MAIGVSRMAPLTYHNFKHFTLQDNVCAHASSLWLSGTSDKWTILWLWFKMIEGVVESVWLVLLKQRCNGSTTMPTYWHMDILYIKLKYQEDLLSILLNTLLWPL